MVILLLGGSTSLISQTQQPTFKGGVTLVTVDVTVLDKDGNPVRDLKPDDFEIKLNNKVQSVKSLAFVQAEGVTAPPPATGAAAAASTPPATLRETANNSTPKGEERVFVILVDDLSFAPVRGKRLFGAAAKFLDSLPPTDIVGFATASGVGTVNPTRDRAPIREALTKVVGQFQDPRGLSVTGPSNPSKDGINDTPDGPVGIADALEIDRGNPGVLKDVIARECFNGSADVFNGKPVESVMAEYQCASAIASEARRTAALTRNSTARQLEAYLQVINAMRGASGIKHLVLLSDGLGITLVQDEMGPLAKAAASAGVQISVLAEEPDLSLSDGGRRALGADGVPQTSIGSAETRRNDDRMLMQGIQTVADVTGGIFHRVIGDPDPFFRRVAAAASGVYRLGIEPPGGSAPGKDFVVAAKVKRSGNYTIRANRRAVLPGPAVVAPIDEQLKAAIATGQALYRVPVALGTALRRSKNGAAPVEVGVNVEVPPTVKGPLTMQFGLRDAVGPVSNGRKVIETRGEDGAYRFSFAMPVVPASYKLRFAVADAEGNLGSVETSFSARLRTLGPFTSSDVLTWFVDSKGASTFLALDDMPANLSTLNASIELYSAAGAPPPADLVVMFTLTGAGKETTEIEREASIENVEGALRAQVELPIDSIAPGTYTLSAKVSAEGKSLGTVTTTVRKKS
ncbi:MAG TPA: VWA domain-containing protein [Vicinamibacterales bacterium]|nr:VWA domain-containing protein [Vicinamibacterales bacterium]